MLICGYLSFQMIKHIEEKEKSNKKKGKIILERSLTHKGQPAKWSNTLKQFVGCVFDDLLGLALHHLSANPTK